MSFETFLLWIAIGLIAGWLASALVGGGYGVIGDIVVGVVGAFLGSLIFRGLHLSVPFSGLPATNLRGLHRRGGAVADPEAGASGVCPPGQSPASRPGERTGARSSESRRAATFLGEDFWRHLGAEVLGLDQRRSSIARPTISRRAALFGRHTLF